ncbi:UDP-2,3-diacylglucosamine diphosphatase [Aliidiomarina indica]|uniref:UDP-2,3-diacylglucosamine diphosphatase n=1 Tax=Aliidiomarina indica TaxID=2749147 RepID=UPI0018908335
MTTTFISDLHLSADRPDITGLFVQFLRTEARSCEALYILGDLFEYWIGDDDNTPFHREVKGELRALTDAGIPCFFIHGNRDFLVGETFAKETGVTLLPEPTVIDLYGIPTVLLHGDTLCTKDVGYQRFRKVIRHPWLLACTAWMPLSWRRKIATYLRDNSAGNGSDSATESKPNKPLSDEQLAKYDATDTAVEALMQETDTIQMIHGHTHRPGIHTHATGTRIVLGDWYEQGSILDVTGTGAHLRSEPLLTR